MGEELLGRERVEGATSKRPTLTHVRGNCTYSFCDHEGRARESSDGHSDKGGCREAETLLPLSPHEIRRVYAARRSMQIMSTNGVLEMLHEDANTNGAL